MIKRLSVGVTSLLAMAVLVAGCSAPQSSGDAAWAEYTAFADALAGADEPAWARHLSQRVSGELAASDPADRAEMAGQVSYPKWLSTTRQHYSRATEDGACLVVNGADSEGLPAAVAVRYQMEGSVLKADEFTYLLAESIDQLPTEARCPSEVTAAFPE